MRELPFDPVRKRMTLVYEEENGARVYVKGAPEVVLERSTSRPTPFALLEDVAEDWASRGLKVLAVAERRLPDASLDDDELEDELRLVGLVALHDPLRATRARAVAEARSAGLRVEMVTGDHPVTAEAIGRALDLPEERDSCTRHARGEAAARRVAAGRAAKWSPSPETASTTRPPFDGRTSAWRWDWPAPRSPARRPISSSRTTTSPPSSPRSGRGARSPTTSGSSSRSCSPRTSARSRSSPIAILAGLGVPMTVVQVLLVNILTDGLPAIALTRDPAAPDTMRRPPERGDRLFPPRAWGALAAVGVLVGVAALAAFLVGRSGSDDEARTMAFATVAFAELALVFSLRSPIRAAWEAPRNLYLIGSVVLSAALVLVAVYVPGPERVARDRRPRRRTSSGSSPCSRCVPFLCVEAGKALFRRVGWTLEERRR